MSATLKPCPFCGSPAEIIGSGFIDNEFKYFVNCGCDSPPCRSIEDVAALWNTRPMETELLAALEAFESADDHAAACRVCNSQADAPCRKGVALYAQAVKMRDAAIQKAKGAGA